MIGSATLDANGNATFSTSDLALGGETITAVYQGDSNYSGSTAAPLSITVGTSDQLFVNQIYLIVLDRPAEQAGLEDWTTDLQDGLSRQKVIRLIIGSPEAQALVQQVRAESSASSTHTPYLTPHRASSTRSNGSTASTRRSSAVRPIPRDFSSSSMS